MLLLWFFVFFAGSCLLWGARSKVSAPKATKLLRIPMSNLCVSYEWAPRRRSAPHKKNNNKEAVEQKRNTTYITHTAHQKNNKTKNNTMLKRIKAFRPRLPETVRNLPELDFCDHRSSSFREVFLKPSWTVLNSNSLTICDISRAPPYLKTK